VRSQVRDNPIVEAGETCWTYPLSKPSARMVRGSVARCTYMRMRQYPSWAAKDDRSEVVGVSNLVEPAFKLHGASERPGSLSQATHARMCPQYVEENRSSEDAAHPPFG